MSHSAFDAAQWQLTCLLLSQPNYHHLGLVKRLMASVSTPTGVAASSAPPGGVIASNLLASYANRFFQFVPESLAASEDQSWTHIYPSPGFGDLPISLGSRDTEITSLRHPFAGGACVPGRRRRRLDTCYLQSERKVDLLHIAEPIAGILQILIGADELIRRDQPILVLEVATAEEIDRLTGHLDGQGYLLLDSALQPLAASKADLGASLTETVFLGLPRTFVERNGLAQAFWPNDKRLTNHPRWQDAITAGFTREARNGRIGFAGRPPGTFHYQFDSQLICEGFYPAENQDDHWWRWLGPKPSARVRLARPPAGRYRFLLRITGVAGDLDVADVRVFLDGARIDTATKTNDGVSTVSASIKFPADEVAQDFELVITVPATQHASAEDGRLLGICISHVELISLSRGERP